MGDLDSQIMKLMAVPEEIRNLFPAGGISFDAFLELAHAEMEPMRRMFADYQCACMEIETKFKVLNERFSVKYDANPIESIRTRVKSPESIVRKLHDRNLPLSIDSIQENLDDIAGIRVICSFQNDIYMLADKFLEQDDITLIERKDYIKDPKPSGYRSLHLIVEVPIFTEEGKKMMRAEVQLRTIAMDFWASLEHKLRYKKKLSDEQMKALSAGLTECSRVTAELDQTMQGVYDKVQSFQNGKPYTKS